VYSDFNVTASLTPGKQMRVCNDRWVSFAAFDKVAIVKGSILASLETEEPQAVGLLQVLQAIDSSITPEWAMAQQGLGPGGLLGFTVPDSRLPGRIVSTPRTTFRWQVVCDHRSDVVWGTVVGLYLRFVRSAGTYDPGLPSMIVDTMHYLPALDDNLVAALRSLPSLTSLWIQVGSGSLLPQLGSLSRLEELHMEYFCFRGTIPKNLVANMPRLHWFQVVPEDSAQGAADPAGGLCGLSGILPELKLRGKRSGGMEYTTALVLAHNQLTGQLPAELLSYAEVIHLDNNHFSGSIPGVTVGFNDSVKTIHVSEISLSNNELTVSSLRAAS
jgi:hypothetical protein